MLKRNKVGLKRWKTMITKIPYFLFTRMTFYIYIYLSTSESLWKSVVAFIDLNRLMMTNDNLWFSIFPMPYQPIWSHTIITKSTSGLRSGYESCYQRIGWIRTWNQVESHPPKHFMWCVRAHILICIKFTKIINQYVA